MVEKSVRSVHCGVYQVFGIFALQFNNMFFVFVTFIIQTLFSQNTTQNKENV